MSVTSMRIDVGGANHAAALRDYFLRLGAVAKLGDDSTVDVHFPEDAINGTESIEEHLRTWVQAHNVSATIVPQLARRNAPLEPLRPPAPPKPEAPQRLGDLLVAKGFITPEQLAYAVVEARKEGELLGRLLLRYEWVFESELARVLAQQWSLPYLNLESIGVDRALVKLLPAEVGTRAAAIPVRRIDEAIQVAFADPTDPTALAAIREHIPSIVPAVAELSDIKNAWRTAVPAVAAKAEREPAPPAPSGRPRIGELFMQAGLITQEDLEMALRRQKGSGKPLGEILVTSGVIDRLNLASALSKQWAAGRSADSGEAAAAANGAPPAVEVEVEDEPKAVAALEPLAPAEPAPSLEPVAPAQPLQPAAPLEPAPPLEEQPDVMAELVQAVRHLSAAVERLHGRLDAAESRFGTSDDEPFTAVSV